MDTLIFAGIVTVVLGVIWCLLLRFAGRKVLIAYTFAALFLASTFSYGVAEIGALFKANNDYTRIIDDFIDALVYATDTSDAGKVKDVLVRLDKVYYATYQSDPQPNEAIKKAINELDPESKRWEKRGQGADSAGQ